MYQKMLITIVTLVVVINATSVKNNIIPIDGSLYQEIRKIKEFFMVAGHPLRNYDFTTYDLFTQFFPLDKKYNSITIEDGTMKGTLYLQDSLINSFVFMEGTDVKNSFSVKKDDKGKPLTAQSIRVTNGKVDTLYFEYFYNKDDLFYHFKSGQKDPNYLIPHDSAFFDFDSNDNVIKRTRHRFNVINNQWFPPEFNTHMIHEYNTKDICTKVYIEEHPNDQVEYYEYDNKGKITLKWGGANEKKNATYSFKYKYNNEDLLEKHWWVYEKDGDSIVYNYIYDDKEKLQQEELGIIKISSNTYKKTNVNSNN